MKLDAALAFYKTQAAVARVLGIKRQAVHQWWDLYGGVVPAKHAIRLQADSRGKVKVDPKDYEPKLEKTRV
jgi:DNA-binding transcriptional regulator YdaS (Cro superfamily)